MALKRRSSARVAKVDRASHYYFDCTSAPCDESASSDCGYTREFDSDGCSTAGDDSPSKPWPPLPRSSKRRKRRRSNRRRPASPIIPPIKFEDSPRSSDLLAHVGAQEAATQALPISLATPSSAVHALPQSLFWMVLVCHPLLPTHSALFLYHFALGAWLNFKFGGVVLFFFTFIFIFFILFHSLIFLVFRPLVSP